MEEELSRLEKRRIINNRFYHNNKSSRLKASKEYNDTHKSSASDYNKNYYSKNKTRLLKNKKLKSIEKKDVWDNHYKIHGY